MFVSFCWAVANLSKGFSFLCRDDATEMTYSFYPDFILDCEKGCTFAAELKKASYPYSQK